MTRARIGRILAAILILVLASLAKHAVGYQGMPSRLLPSLVLWIAFFAYWAYASRNSAPTQSSESWGSTYLHQGALGVALLLLYLPVPGLNGWFIPERFQFAVVIGGIVQVLGLLLAVWARRHLGRNWAAEVRIGVDHELVRTGPYRWIRHPIYTAMLTMFLGTAIACGQYHALLGVAILFVAYIRKTRLEEEILSRTFPTDYEAYRRATWRLVPPVF
ncbi:MAG TPA: isoprenylcysteine carboxylmethyltransferase family protein [Gemmatimonadaceae bacterium]|nr:isoprenylcysteine carboxylmethyltransferase family protein [Gemmatimonadaceae bacterium]